MELMKEPNIAFTNWKPWSTRSRLSDCLDVPPDFDFGGLYLLAHFKDSEDVAHNSMASHLLPEVIYIGMSKRLTGRTQNHEKVARQYKSDATFLDRKCERLYFAHCELGFGWHSWDLSHGNLARVKLAFVQYVERKLIWEYAKKFNRLPSLNLK